jgi:hypothetical protein
MPTRLHPAFHDRIHSRHLDPAEHDLDTRLIEDRVEQACGCQYSFTAADQQRIELADVAMSHRAFYHRGLGHPRRGTEEYRRSMNGQCEDYALCEPDATEVTDCVHRSSGSRAPAPAQLLDHLPRLRR